VALRAAVFLDKDGTLVHDVPYNIDADRVRLKPDAGPALARLHEAGYALVLVTNQPGVARGLFDESELAPLWIELARQLAPHGVGFEAVYYCPHHPQGSNRRYAHACRCRKPEPGMLFRAAAEHGYDLARSWMVGDILDDVEAGRSAGCRTVLLDVGSETEWRVGAWREPHFVAGSLAGAVDCILGAAAALGERAYE
jgi:D-glycero-D-manno-heptose 1,7-bisphosphate phosphatase